MSRAAAIGIAASLILFTALGSLLWQKSLRPPLPVLDTLGGDFTLPSTLGHDVNLSDYRGKVVLLNFGFTSCPDVCPTVLARLRKTIDTLKKDANQVQVLFVTIDPERDSLEKLQQYLPYFHTQFIGLRGSNSQLNNVAARYKVLYQREDIDSDIGYSFLHNDHIYLIDQQGRVRAMLSGSASPESIAEQLRSLL